MRICFATDGVFPHVSGGMQRHSAFLVRHLAALGAEVDVIHPTPGVTCFPGVDRVREFVVPEVRFPHYLTACYLSSRRVARFLKGRTYDVGVSQGLPLWAYLPRRAFPCAFHPHGLEPFRLDLPGEHWKLALFRWAERGIARRADLVISLGGELTRIVREDLAMPEERIAVLPNGIDPAHLDALRPPGETRRPHSFLFAGRLQPVKGIADLLAAFQGVAVPDAHLYIAGDGPLRAELERRADPARVTFLGQLDDRALFRWYARVECFCLSSLWEGMPTAVMEAMGTGLPVIATDVGAVAELVPEGTGERVPPGDRAALREAMERFCRLSPREKAARGRAAREWVRGTFAWDRVATRTLAALEALARRGMRAGA